MEIIKYEDLTNAEVVSKKLAEELSKVLDILEKSNVTILNNDDKKAAKNYLAEIRKVKDTYESERKALKNELLKPYEQFNDLYNTQLLNPILEAENKLKQSINDFAQTIIEEYTQELKAYFEETNNLSWLTYDRLNLKVTDADNTVKKLKKEIDAKLAEIDNDIKLLNNLDDKELLIEKYKETLNVQAAIETVTQAKALLKGIAPEEATSQNAGEFSESDTLALKAESQEEAELLTLQVKLTTSQLKDLINYLNDKGITYSL